MKKDFAIIYIAALLLILAAVAFVAINNENRQLKAERDKYRNNTEVLATACEQYRVQDSLSAARVRSLELTVDEFERYRAADAVLIKQLKQKNRDLASVNDVQSQTIIDLSTRPRDTVVVIDSTPTPAKAVHCGDDWYDFDGLLTDDAFSGRLQVRDSLIVTESVEHARFLGFLWKTSRIKNRQMDVLSRNPHTEINDVIYVVIED